MGSGQERRHAFMSEVTIIPAQEKEAGTKETRNLRVAAYVRVSTLSEEQEESFENQKQHYEELVGMHPRWDLIKIYADQASGLNTKKRTQFNTMMRDARCHKFDVLYVKSISRFARNTITTLTAIRELNGYGIKTIFEKENLVSTDPGTNIMLSLMASMAESESLSISENVNLGLKYKYSRGEWSANFTNFLGYDKLPDGTVVINEEQAGTVKEIFDDFLSGMSLEQLKEKLEAQGRKTGTGGTRWTKTAILRILSNIKYSGDVIQGITTTVDVINKKRIINKGNAPQYFIRDGIPAIVDKQTYLLAKGELARREKYFIDGGGVDGPEIYCGKYPLTRKILCPKCRQYYNHRTARGKDIWECYGRIHNDCKAEILNETELKAAILKALQILWDTRPHIKDYLVPELSSNDTEEALIEAAGLFTDNVFAQRTKAVLERERPAEYDPGLARQVIRYIVPYDDHLSIEFYGADPINVDRIGSRRNVISGRRLKRT